MMMLREDPTCNQENCCNRTGTNLTACCSDQDKPLAKNTKIILISVHVILAVATIFGNSLVLKAFHKFSSLRTASNTILVSLSVADSLITIAFIAQIFLIAFSHTHWFHNLCTLSAHFNHLLISVIILHLALISVERFIAVKFSLRYHTILTNRRALFASIAAWLWVVAATLVFPHALRVSNSIAYKSLVQAMHPCSKTHAEGPLHVLPPLTRGYLIFLVISLLVIPLVIILCCYGYIFIVSHKHRQQIKEQNNIPAMPTIKHEMKGARTLAIVVALCLLSIVPLLVVTSFRFFHALLVCHHPELKCIKYIVYDVAFGLNAICNPLIYGCRNEKFRNAFRKLLKCT